MIAAFCRANPTATEQKEVYLMFDGDRLEPEMRVGETELSDMDHIDVYVK